MEVKDYFEPILKHVERDNGPKNGYQPILLSQLLTMLWIYENEVGRDEFYESCKIRVYDVLKENNIMKGIINKLTSKELGEE